MYFLVNLIDSMLVVEPEKRFTVDDCLAHPWMTLQTPGVNDSTDGLVGGLAGLEVNRRGVVRERTLLSSINSVQMSQIPASNGKEPIEVYKKNAQTVNIESRPFDGRNTEEFMALGGKGDQELYGDDATSHYTKADTALTHKDEEAEPSPTATPTKNGNGQHAAKPKSTKGKGKGNKR